MKTNMIMMFLLLGTIISINAKDKKQNMEKFYYSKTVNGSYEDVYERVQKGISEVGFGIVTEVAIHEKVKGKLGKDMPVYQVLGVCNPKHAYDAIQENDNIGIFLPCKVLIKEKGENTFEVVTINANEVMGITGQEGLKEVAGKVDDSLKTFMDNLK